uniref:hypothetical protein n=1 Tax=Streptococcus suis TaxID=1307 RepID=UPI0037574F04
MADTILILGNGFDLAMKRKTSYEDFLRFIDYFYIINKLGGANVSDSDIYESVNRVKAQFNDCFSFVLAENVELLEYFRNLSVEEIIILFQNLIIEALHKENDDFQTVFLEFLNPKLHSWMGEFGEDLINEVQGRIAMVFGIEDKDDEIESINSDLIPFQKFYQRTVKETGNDFELFFTPTIYFDEKDEFYSAGNIYPKNIIVFGHSVDPLDKEIFRKCFNLAEQGGYQYQFLFCYYNESAKLSIVKNLAIILGKNKLIELTGKNKIKFIKYDDVNRMKKELY